MGGSGARFPTKKLVSSDFLFTLKKEKNIFFYGGRQFFGRMFRVVYKISI